ncbi:hypothetical protein C4588_02725 [Candidatus Parcubacteria bacterium]|nr:MAG: hypothetical protein C4588_02725 [Candidatus Parcubacteria bacterium]
MKKFDKSIFNPFDYINPERIRKNVNKIKDRHPDWEKEDICRELVKRKSRICAGTGAISALPSSIPGLGTFVTIAGGTAVDLATLVYFLSELTLEIATVYNRNPSNEATIKEALWVLSSCFGVESATLGVSKVAIINTSKKALAKIIEKLFTIIGGWLSKNILLRMLPVVGSLVNAYINSKACKHAGREIVLWYKTNLEQDIEWAKTGEKDGSPEEGGEEKDDLPDENIIFEPMDEEMDMDFEREDFITADETLDENTIDGEGETIIEPDIDIEKLRTSDKTIEEPLPDIGEIEIDEKSEENIIDIGEIEILEETFEEIPPASDREKDFSECSKEEVKIKAEEEVFEELKEEKNIETPVLDEAKVEEKVETLSEEEEEEDSEEEMENIDADAENDDKAEDTSDKNLTVEAKSDTQEKKKKFIKKIFKKKKKK